MIKSTTIKIAFFLMFIRALSTAQTTMPEPGNIVEILPDDSHDEIIRKAANVIPSANQMAWQEMELTAFLHFHQALSLFHLYYFHLISRFKFILSVKKIT